MTRSLLPSLVQQFFTDRLCTQLDASPNTIAGYRDTFRLLLRHVSEKTGRAPTRLSVEHLDVEMIADFLSEIETRRGNSARTRNTRLAGIRSFFRFVAMREPRYMLHCQRILAMPGKRYVRRTVEFLDRHEIDAVLSAPDRTTRIGRRDHAILLTALQTGLRATEIANLKCSDVLFGAGAHIRCEGKGRKHRTTPLRRAANPQTGNRKEGRSRLRAATPVKDGEAVSLIEDRSRTTIRDGRDWRSETVSAIFYGIGFGHE